MFGNLEYRQLADESLSTTTRPGLEISSPFSRFPCDPARQPVPSRALRVIGFVASCGE